MKTGKRGTCLDLKRNEARIALHLKTWIFACVNSEEVGIICSEA